MNGGDESILSTENDLKEHGKNANAAALATSVFARVRNSTMSAFHYRISTLLFHSGTMYEDMIRLNLLGICMSPDAVISHQMKMGDQLESKVHISGRRPQKKIEGLFYCVMK